MKKSRKKLAEAIRAIKIQQFPSLVHGDEEKTIYAAIGPFAKLNYFCKFVADNIITWCRYYLSCSFGLHLEVLARVFYDFIQKRLSGRSAWEKYGKPAIDCFRIMTLFDYGCPILF